MKSVYCFMGTALASLLIGCSSTPVVFPTVGPNPTGGKSASAMGELQVFSCLVGCSEGDNPPWYQHTDYRIYDVNGKLVKRVGNTIGHYEQAPRSVALSAGHYFVKAQAQDYSWIKVPVTIEDARTTRVHLDDNWKPPAGTPETAIVSLPDGNAAGWRADSVKKLGIN
jgi:hypothetical protein